jgi:hypothetical protein
MRTVNAPPWAADAEPDARGYGAARPIQHQSDGCADEAVLHNGCGAARGALCGWSNHGRSEDRRNAISPIFAGFLFSRPALIDIPFFIAGTLKIACDLALYREFRAIRPPEEAD